MPPTLIDLAIARHDTFHIRDGWLLKGLHAIRGDQFALSKLDVHHALGVGKNMASAIRYWVQATGLAAPAGPRVNGRVPLHWTRSAEFVVQYDQFLEDIATLWLLHLELASAADIATFWYWAFNECEDTAFSEEDLVLGFLAWSATVTTDPVNENSVKKDASVFVRTYRAPDRSTSRILDDPLDCPLTALRLVRATGSVKPYSFAIESKPSLPIQVVAYAILRYCQCTKPGIEAISIDELRWAPGGPGRLLLLDARSLTEISERLEEISKGAWIRVHQTAGVRNVHIGDVDLFDPLRWYYERHGDDAIR